jgi:hypothetical protein
VPRRALPPAPGPALGGVPPAVPVMAGLGLAVLFFYTLPAVRTQHRVEQDHRRLQRQVRAAEAEIGRLRRELRAGPEQAYLRIKATRDLLHRGTRYLRGRDRRLGR